jgi:DNA-binding NtrC family response regulator
MLDLLHTEATRHRAAVRAVRDEVAAAGLCDASVMISGEPRIGREVIARLIHRRGARRRGPLTIIKTGGVSESVLASRLFRAFSTRNGTVFLDNVGELSACVQDLVFALLEANQVPPAGSGERGLLDVRLITGSHRSLLPAVAAGIFREDLYYRLNVALITLPPLERACRIFQPSWGLPCR